MTVRLPAWLQTGSYGAELDRSVGTALLSPANALTGRGGVRRYTGTEFQVTQNSPVAMTVLVAPGMAWVQGAFSTTQGAYTVVNDAQFAVTISAAASSPRIDLIILEVLDSVYNGSSNLAQVRVVTGTPASSPTVPTATGSYIALAQVLVPANATSIVTANITDLRPFGSLVNTPIPVRNVAERNALPLFDGLQVYRMDAGWEINTYVSGSWYGSATRVYSVATANVSTYSTSSSSAKTIVDRVKIADPGVQYLLELNYSGEVYGARVEATGYAQSTTTTSFSNPQWYGQSLDATEYDTYQRVQMRGFAYTGQVFSGNQWVTVTYQNVYDTGTAWVNTTYHFLCQISVVPTVPGAVTIPALTGGQP